MTRRKHQKIFLITILSLLILQFSTPSFSLVSVLGKQADQERFSSVVRVYWVEAGANGEGTSESSPAGNITYILDTYNLTNSVVRVKPGIYNAQIERFPLTLNYDGVTLEATGSPSDTIIYGPSGIEEDYSLVKVTAEEITVRGFTIKNYGMAILVESSRNTIEGNYIANNKMGIDLAGSNNIVKDNTIKNNTEIGMGIGGSSNVITKNTITANNYGVSISGSNNTVKGNTITNNKWFGVDIGGSSNMIIGNTITENEGIGITAHGSDNTVRDNIINSNSIGISISYSMNNLIKDNNVSNNRGYGILLEDTSNNTIEGNTITNNSKEGIKLSLNVDDTTIRNNTIRHNGVGDSIFILFEGLPTLALGVGVAFLTVFIAFHFFKKRRES
jgi:parallel beta-helix repeat protein